MQQKLKVMVADDEKMTRKSLVNLIEQFCPTLEVCCEVGSINDAVAYLQQTKVDILFLDIQFGNEGTGFDILNQLKKYNCEVVFVTAHEEYALEAFRYNAINYLLKPVYAADLLETVERISKIGNKTQALQPVAEHKEENRFLLLPSKTQTDIIISDIEYIEGGGSYSTYHLTNGKEYLLSKNMTYFEAHTKGNTDFIRVSRSFIVNKNHIQSIGKATENCITMKSGALIYSTLSHSYLLNAITQ